MARLWPTERHHWPLLITARCLIGQLSWDNSIGAGEGNRTLMTSLEDR